MTALAAWCAVHAATAQEAPKPAAKPKSEAPAPAKPKPAGA